MPDPALLKLLTTANSLVIGALALVLLACVTVILVALCLAAIRLKRLVCSTPVTGEIVTLPEPDIVEGVFVDARPLALRRRAYTR